jgi:uncharacterized protein YgiB involved in biofilm formation
VEEFNATGCREADRVVDTYANIDQCFDASDVDDDSVDVLTNHTISVSYACSSKCVPAGHWYSTM